MNNFDKVLNCILEGVDEPKSAVAIVKDRDKWLLGLSTSMGDRRNKWCHPGGGIKPGETPKKAAERECHEETGIRCRAIGEPFIRKNIAFVPCKKTGGELNPNSEFAALGFFTEREMRSLKLLDNVKELITKAKKC